MNREMQGYYLAFSQCNGIGPMRFNRFLQYFGSAKSAYNASRMELEKAVGKGIAARFIEFRNTFNIEERLSICEGKHVHVLAREDSHFPYQLLNFEDAPICFYAKGDLNVIDFKRDRFFAIVGTRSPTEYGLYVAEWFGRELSPHFVIVSGLAYGIDVEAHRAALDSGNRTIAFLGCGIDIPYPAGNREIYKRIVDGGGLVISEFAPGVTSEKGLFVSRNRHISGLSEGVLVVEGTDKSGALITAKTAAHQGVDVFAPPAPINSTQSAAPNGLILDGAKMVLSPSDILEAYEIAGLTKKGRHYNLNAFTPDEQTVIKILLNESQRGDDIIISTGFSPNKVMSIVSLLEVNGVLKKNGDGRYALA